jgi:hypothetical protein
MNFLAISYVSLKKIGLAQFFSGGVLFQCVLLPGMLEIALCVWLISRSRISSENENAHLFNPPSFRCAKLKGGILNVVPLRFICFHRFCANF